MPLLKLWNSIRGRSGAPESSQQPAADGSDRRSKDEIPPKPRGRGGFGFFGGPHSGLCKWVKSVPARTVLEISVGDGSRALAVLKTLAKTESQVRYLAIDQFEMVDDGAVTLKRFHQTLRAEGITAQLFPDEIDRGLMRIAHTVGAIDLILIAADPESWQNDATLSLLSRLCHDQTVVLCLDGDTWERFEMADQNCRIVGRRAA